jgi:hypothetical protein
VADTAYQGAGPAIRVPQRRRRIDPGTGRFHRLSRDARAAIREQHQAVLETTGSLQAFATLTPRPHACGGEVAGRSPVDRGKQGMKRSVATDGHGIRCTSSRPARAPTTRRCSSRPWPGRRDDRHAAAVPRPARRRRLPEPAPGPRLRAHRGQGSTRTYQAGRRWPVERTHSWMNGYGKLRICTDRRKVIVGFWLCLAAAFTVMAAAAASVPEWPQAWEVIMPVVGGIDIHRAQLTFDYVDLDSGEVVRGRIAPADRERLRRFAGRDQVAFALEGCTGWRYVAEDSPGSRSVPGRPRQW